MDTPEMPMDLRLAAIVHILSSTALRGATPGKTEALRAHLRGAVTTSGINPHLQSILAQVLDGWEAVECHPASVAYSPTPLACPGGLTH